MSWSGGKVVGSQGIGNGPPEVVAGSTYLQPAACQPHSSRLMLAVRHRAAWRWQHCIESLAHMRLWGTAAQGPLLLMSACLVPRPPRQVVPGRGA